MISHKTARFRKAFSNLPSRIQKEAKESYKLFKMNPNHPNLYFKKIHPVRPIYSVRISLDYRAIGFLDGNEMIWFWIGSHSEYEKLISHL
jgi:mRNA-degrading endonuclease RelE of RelBE toxin-antitoxin system